MALSSKDKKQYDDIAKRIKAGTASSREQTRYKFLGSKAARSSKGGQDKGFFYDNDTRGTQVGEIERVAPSVINTVPQDEMRARQIELYKAINDRISGSTPFMADYAYQKANQDAVQNAFSLARSAKLANPAMGLRAAMGAASGAGQNNALAYATARGAELAQGQSELSNLANITRTADVGLANSQAALNQQAALANQEEYNRRLVEQGRINAAIKQAQLQAESQRAAAKASAEASKYASDTSLLNSQLPKDTGTADANAASGAARTSQIGQNSNLVLPK